MKKIFIISFLLILARIAGAQNVGIGTTMPASTLDVNGSVANKVATITGATTLTSSDAIVLCNSSSNFNVTLPSAIGIDGRMYTIKNVNTGSVTIMPFAGETIDGTSSKILSFQNANIEIISNGSQWYILDDNSIRSPMLNFATDLIVNNNDYVGEGTCSSSFLKNSVVAPFDMELTSITFSIRALWPGSITATIYVNNLNTGLSATIANGLGAIWGSATGSYNVLKGDLISIRISSLGLSNGIACSVTYK